MILEKMIPILQLAIGPVILISGFGLILLSITNRFGRIIDRTRFLIADLRKATEGDKSQILEEIRILSKRAKVVRSSIAFLALSILLVAVLIITLFVGTLYNLKIAQFVVALFVSCMLALIISIILFILDINLSLKALWIEYSPFEK